ncbi:MAG: hypothetical protein JRD04_11075, partial [Deltaproteobacteria bacterium]|nr:hypothetical protein [Deltaproteobacteria bacterium]
MVKYSRRRVRERRFPFGGSWWSGYIKGGVTPALVMSFFQHKYFNDGGDVGIGDVTTFARPSGKSYWDADGNIATAAVDEPIQAFDVTHIAGPELVTNGGFDTNIDGFKLTGTGTVNPSSGLMFMRVLAAGDGMADDQVISVAVGKQYSVTMEVALLGYSGTDVELVIDGLVFNVSGMSTTNTEIGVAAHTAITNDMTIELRGAGTATGTMFIDNISVKAVESKPVLEGILTEPSMTRLNTYPICKKDGTWNNNAVTSAPLFLNALGVFDGVEVVGNGNGLGGFYPAANTALLSAANYGFVALYRAGTSGKAMIKIRNNTAGTNSLITGDVGSLVVTSSASGAIAGLSEVLLSDGITYLVSGYFTPAVDGDFAVSIGHNSVVVGESVIALGAFIGGAGELLPHCPILGNDGATQTTAADVWTLGPVAGGVELVDNGGFVADTDWTKGASWAITGGEAVFDGLAAGNLTQAGVGDSSAKLHTVTLDISDVVGAISVQGVTRIMIGGGTKVLISADEVIAEGPRITRQVVDGNSGGGLWIEGVLGRSYKLDNVSVQEIAPFEGFLGHKGTWVLKAKFTHIPVGTS